MTTYRVACIREQGTDLVIVPLDATFGQKSGRDQQTTIRAIGAGAAAGGLQGTVVPVWRQGRRLRFVAPSEWEPFFKDLSWDLILLKLNREVTGA